MCRISSGLLRSGYPACCCANGAAPAGIGARRLWVELKDGFLGNVLSRPGIEGAAAHVVPIIMLAISQDYNGGLKA